MSDGKAQKQQLDDVKKLSAIARESLLKGMAALDEIDRLMGGGQRSADMLKQAEAAFDRLWGARYAAGQAKKYLWQYQRDRPNLTRLLRTLGLDEVTARMARYIASDDGFLAKNRHPFGLFVNQINTFAREDLGREFSLGRDESGVVGCSHQPPCISDADHTRRRRTELHG